MNNIENSNEIITYQYKFTFNNDSIKEFNVKLDKINLYLIHKKTIYPPKWAEMECFQCPNCPIDKEKEKYCPIAINITDLIEFFGEYASYEKANVLINSKERGYIKTTTLQKGLSSLLGIYMVTSGCPIMNKLKPMVFYHLPFSTPEETNYRVISMYLIAQYFLYKKGKNPDWELKKLIEIYDDIQIVNRNFRKRLSDINIKDASINALVILDNFATYLNFSINVKNLSEMEALFSAYFDE